MKNEKLGNKVSDTSPYLRINEACAFLRVSRSTLYRIIEKTGLEVLTGSGIRPFGATTYGGSSREHE